MLADSPLPACSSPEEYRHTERMSEALFFYGRWNPKQCACSDQCMRTLFSVSLESTTDGYNPKKGYDRARIRLYYQVP